MDIYVGNLSYKISDQELREVFEKFGTVNSAKVIKDRKTDRSKGFGFVEMSSEKEAQAAIKMLDGSEVNGRIIKVNKARPKTTTAQQSRIRR